MYKTSMQNLMRVENGARSVFWHLATPTDSTHQRTEIQDLVIQSLSVESPCVGNSKIMKISEFHLSSSSCFSLQLQLLQLLAYCHHAAISLVRCFATIMTIPITFAFSFQPFYPNSPASKIEADHVPSDIEPSYGND